MNSYARGVARAAALVALIFLSTNFVFAQSTGQNALDQIRKSGLIKIGTEGTYAPFTYHDASGALVGFDVEIAREIARRIGVSADFVEGKWDGLIAGLDAKRYDIVANEVTITQARKAKYDFSQPYIVSKAVLIVKDDNTSISSFSDLKGKRRANRSRATMANSPPKMAPL